jgi:hypothetical protein
MKPKKKSELKLFPLVICILIGLAFIFIAIAPKINLIKHEDPKQTLNKTLDHYFDSLPVKEDWWMGETLPANLEAADALAYAVTNVQLALENTKHTNPLTEEIAKTFPQFVTSIYRQGISAITVRGHMTPEFLENKLEICFVSGREFRDDKLPAALYFREDWNAVMMAAVRWPEPFFSAVLFHELGHALRHKARSSSPEDQTKWLAEEVEMHELEGEILNARTGGKYFEALDRIIAKNRSCRDTHELLAEFRTKDLFELDRIIGLEKQGILIRNSSCAEHAALLGFRYIDKIKGLSSDKIAHYRWIADR